MLADTPFPVFLDASCLLAAAGSAYGGSSVVLHLCSVFLIGVVSAPILTEAERSIQAKLPEAAWERWQYLLLTTPFLVIPVPEDAQQYAAAVTAKDAHVYAAALAAGIQHVITLDLPLARRINGLGSRVEARTPGEFITRVLRHR